MSSEYQEFEMVSGNNIGALFMNTNLGGGLVVSNIFYFHPYLGKIPVLTNIFQMG